MTYRGMAQRRNCRAAPALFGVAAILAACTTSVPGRPVEAGNHSSGSAPKRREQITSRAA
jgi:hypothetical protein